MEIVMELVRYEAACRAVAAARTIDEVKEITNRAEAARAYARQAKDRRMEIDAIEIRVRAERRLGEIVIDLKKTGAVASQGVRDYTTTGERNVPRLSELGIDRGTSVKAQRLAMVPESTFASEMAGWRQKAESPSRPRIEVPLQVYRRPSIKADRQKAARRNGRNQIDTADPLDCYRSIDGRRIADWRFGELDRLADLGRRVLLCAETLKREMPVANPDPLATVEMIFDSAALAHLLAVIWRDPIPLAQSSLRESNAGLAETKWKRTCEHCRSVFRMRNPSGKARAGKSNEGRYCSRACALACRGSANVPRDRHADKI
jgi:hypothetical protein